MGEPNDQGIKSIPLAPDNNELSVILRDAEGEHQVRAGCGFYVETVTTIPGARLHHSYQPAGGLRVLASARLLENDGASAVLEMDWIFVETAFRDTVRLRFADDLMTLSRRVNVNSSELELPDIKGRLPEQHAREKQHG